MISIVVTNYNGEDFIERCILSILNNSFREFEIIIVDDASTDNSISIIKSIKDNRIKLICLQENKGAGNARYEGLKCISGNYFIFIDNDDYIDNDFLETLYNTAIKHNSDLVLSEAKNITRLTSQDGTKIDRILRGNQFLNTVLLGRHLADKVEYCRRRYIEDTPTFFKYVYYSKNPIEIDYAGYNYCANPRSLTHIASEVRTFMARALFNLDVTLFKQAHSDCISKFGSISLCRGHNQIITESKDRFFREEPEMTTEWFDLYNKLKQ